MKDNYKSRIMKNLFNYWFKTNKKSLYDQLGKEFNVSGFRVYKLAHGKTAYSHMDRLILEKLSVKSGSESKGPLISYFLLYNLYGHHTSCIFGLTPSGRWG